MNPPKSENNRHGKAPGKLLKEIKRTPISHKWERWV